VYLVVVVWRCGRRRCYNGSRVARSGINPLIANVVENASPGRIAFTDNPTGETAVELSVNRR
jgi:hypothetical protein